MPTPDESLSDDVKPLVRPRVRLFWLMIVLALIAVAATWILMPPRFKTEAVVFVGSPVPKIPLEIRQPVVPPEIMSRFVAEQVVLLKDDSLLNGLLKDAAVRATGWFQSMPSENEALDNLKDNLSVFQLPDTSCVRVAFSTCNPKDAPVIVNTAIQRYLAEVRTTSIRELGTELTDVEKTRVKLEADRASILAAKQDYLTKRLGMPGVTQGLNVVGETLCTFAAEAARLETEKLTHQAAWENLRSLGAESIPISPTTRITIEQDPRMVQLRSRGLELELEIAASQPATAAGNGEPDRLRKQLQVIDHKLISLAAQLESEARDYLVKSTETAYLNAMEAELKVREDLTGLEAQQKDIDRGMAGYRQLEERQLLLEDQLARINDYVNQLKMVVGAQGMVQGRQIGMARSPESPDYERQVQCTVIALAIPVAYGVLLILIRLVRGPRRNCRSHGTGDPVNPSGEIMADAFGKSG